MTAEQAVDKLQHAKIRLLKCGDRDGARLLALVQQNINSCQQQMVEVLWRANG